MTTARPTPGESAELDALAALAHREHRAGRLAEAAEAYFQILARRSDVAEIYNNLGSVLSDQGKFDEAVVQYERASLSNPASSRPTTIWAASSDSRESSTPP